MIKPEDLLPIKTLQQLMDDTRTRLRDLKFRITNWRPGGVFYTLVAMAHQGTADLYKLIKDIVPQIYVHSATGFWLEVAAAEYECYRILAQKTKGDVIFGRNELAGNVVINAGKIVGTKVNRQGQRLQFIVETQTVLEEDQLEVPVPVLAEFAGAGYNVGADQITEIITPIDGIDYVRNAEDWITREGSDNEDEEIFRARALSKWDQLAVGPGDTVYQAWAQEIPGVVVVQIDSQHPRGEGTLDIIITSTAGIPTQQLIDEVQAYIDARKPGVANVLVVAPIPVTVDFDVVLHVHPEYGDLSEVTARAEEIIDIMFRYGSSEEPEILKVSPSWGLTRAQVIANLMSIEYVMNVTVTAPAADIAPSNRELAVKGAVIVSAQRLA